MHVCKNVSAYVNNKNMAFQKKKSNTVEKQHSINTRSFMFMTNMHGSGQGHPEGQMWTTGRKMPRSDLNAVYTFSILRK